MATKKMSDELKEAVKALPLKEKDRLLIRLIPKAKNLVEQLEFKLLELEQTREERRNDVRRELEAAIDHYSSYHYQSNYSQKLLRDMSGKINHHVTITKDKYGEVELNLLMLNAVYDFTELQDGNLGLMLDEKFYVYIAKRLLKIMKILSKLHEDYHIDFSDALQSLYTKMKATPHQAGYNDDIVPGWEVIEYGEVMEF